MGSLLGMHLGHNANYTLAIDGEIKETLEFERMTNVKNGGCLAQRGVKSPKIIMKLALDYMLNKYGLKRLDKIAINPLDRYFLLNNFIGSEAEILNFFKADEYVMVDHQLGHMACAYYQSPFDEVKGCSFDGGGNDGNFNVFQCSRRDGIRQIDFIQDHTLGMRLAELGHYAKSIRKEQEWWVDGGLVYPGKIMGFSFLWHSTR